jgi:hypothetical protein
MGLDMYLNAKKYIGSDEPVSVEGVDAGNLKLKELTYKGMYWRKANQIHNWFVDHVQDGVDDCKEHYVEKDVLIDLMNVCGEVIADPSKAAKLLPSSGGFFFGSIDYDDWYWENVKRTYEELKELLKLDLNNDHWSFTYQSSW